MNEWFNHQSFEHHHLIEFEEEAFLFAFLALIVIRATAGQLVAPWQPVCSLYPPPQLPPPK